MKESTVVKMPKYNKNLKNYRSYKIGEDTFVHVEGKEYKALKKLIRSLSFGTHNLQDRKSQ